MHVSVRGSMSGERRAVQACTSEKLALVHARGLVGTGATSNGKRGKSLLPIACLAAGRAARRPGRLVEAYRARTGSTRSLSFLEMLDHLNETLSGARGKTARWQFEQRLSRGDLRCQCGVVRRRPPARPRADEHRTMRRCRMRELRRWSDHHVIEPWRAGAVPGVVNDLVTLTAVAFDRIIAIWRLSSR